jgi:hypothetical protein
MPATIVTEIWKSVVGWEGWYSISNLGRIRREVKGRGVKAGHISISHSPQSYEYATFTLCRNEEKNHVTIHRLVAAAFLGPCPIGMEVNHRNGRKLDNRIENLEYVTAAINIRHARDVLGFNRGELHGRAKLTNFDVRTIRAKHAGGVSQKQLAAEFQVGKMTINRLLRKETWRHVP